MNRASSPTGWVRNPVMKSAELNPAQADSYELGWTHNPITGCLNHVDGMCKGGGFPCYAYREANGRLKKRYLANKEVSLLNIQGVYEDTMNAEVDRRKLAPFYPRFWSERLADIKRAPLPWFHQGKDLRKGIFVCDMGELFGDWVPQKWQEEVFRVIKLNDQHRFYLLTKQPQNLAKWSPFPDNCWVGVTATNLKAYREACVGLSVIQAKVKYLSIEPFLDHIPMHPTYEPAPDFCNWIILGAQTRPAVYPRIDWVQDILVAAHNAGDLPVFIKDNLKPLIEKEWPGWKILQEMPV